MDSYSQYLAQDMVLDIQVSTYQLLVSDVLFVLLC